jgi:MFS family permease
MDDATLPLLQLRPFRMLTFSRFASRLAQNALNFALILLIVDETGRAIFSSLLVLALVLPTTVFGLIAGAAADHLPRRPLILFGHLVRAGICVWAGYKLGGTASYYLIAVGLASAAPFASAAEGALLPLAVPRPRLARANAISHAVAGAAQLLGLGLLTPIILRAFHEPRVLFFICAGLYAAAGVYGVAIGRISRPERLEVGGSASGRWWLAGWRQMRSDSAVMHAVIELTLISTAIIVLGGLIPKYISDVLDLPVDIGAVVLIPGAIGVALGLRIAGFLAHRVPHSLLSSVGFVSFVVLLGLLACVNPLSEFLGGYGWFSFLNSVDIGTFDGGGVIAMIIVAPLGFAYAVVTVAGQTVIQDRVPIQLLGRVGATEGALAALAASFPVLIFGALGDWLGVSVVMALLAGATGLAAMLTLRTERE